jgi:hypothetical protein
LRPLYNANVLESRRTRVLRRSLIEAGFFMPKT